MWMRMRMRVIRIKAAVLLAGCGRGESMGVSCSDVSDESGVLMFFYCDGLDYLNSNKRVMQRNKHLIRTKVELKDGNIYELLIRLLLIWVRPTSTPLPK